VCWKVRVLAARLKLIASADLHGLFALDISEGWRVVPQTGDLNLIEGDTPEGILVRFAPGEANTDKLFSMALKSLRGIMPGAPLEGKAMDLEANANPAR
jgi:hypothetical protein